MRSSALTNSAGRRRRGHSLLTCCVLARTLWSELKRAFNPPSIELAALLPAFDVPVIIADGLSNLTGLLIHFGPIQPATLLQQLRKCLSDIGARESPTVALDTTHFVCTTPVVGGDESGRGGSIDTGYQQAVRANLPVVGPDWLLAVARDRKCVIRLTDFNTANSSSRLVPISNYLLPALPQNTNISPDPAPFRRPEAQKRSSLPFTSSAPSSPISDRPEEIRRSPSPETIARMSMTGRGLSAERRESLDRTGSGDAASERSRFGRSPSRRKTSLPLDAELGRPRSPKPEANGKLDR